MANHLNILLIYEHAMYREAVARVLHTENATAVVLEADSVDHAIEELNRCGDVSLVLLDLSTPGFDERDGLRMIKNVAPAVPIVVVTESEYASDLGNGAHAGAMAFAPKSCSRHRMESTLRAVLCGEIYTTAHFSRGALSANTGLSARGPAMEKSTLTPRQMEVLTLMCTGLSNKGIANRLNVAEGTIKLHVNAILRGLHCRNRTSAVMEAVRRSMIRDTSTWSHGNAV